MDGNAEAFPELVCVKDDATLQSDSKALAGLKWEKAAGALEAAVSGDNVYLRVGLRAGAAGTLSGERAGAPVPLALPGTATARLLLRHWVRVVDGGGGAARTQDPPLAHFGLCARGPYVTARVDVNRTLTPADTFRCKASGEWMFCIVSVDAHTDADPRVRFAVAIERPTVVDNLSADTGAPDSDDGEAAPAPVEQKQAVFNEPKVSATSAGGMETSASEGLQQAKSLAGLRAAEGAGLVAAHGAASTNPVDCSLVQTSAGGSGVTTGSAYAGGVNPSPVPVAKAPVGVPSSVRDVASTATHPSSCKIPEEAGRQSELRKSVEPVRTAAASIAASDLLIAGAALDPDQPQTMGPRPSGDSRRPSLASQTRSSPRVRGTSAGELVSGVGDGGGAGGVGSDSHLKQTPAGVPEAAGGALAPNVTSVAAAAGNGDSGLKELPSTSSAIAGPNTLPAAFLTPAGVAQSRTDIGGGSGLVASASLSAGVSGAPDTTPLLTAPSSAQQLKGTVPQQAAADVALIGIGKKPSASMNSHIPKQAPSKRVAPGAPVAVSHVVASQQSGADQRVRKLTGVASTKQLAANGTQLGIGPQAGTKIAQRPAAKSVGTGMVARRLQPGNKQVPAKTAPIGGVVPSRPVGTAASGVSIGAVAGSSNIILGRGIPRASGSADKAQPRVSVGNAVRSAQTDAAGAGPIREKALAKAGQRSNNAGTRPSGSGRPAVANVAVRPPVHPYLMMWVGRDPTDPYEPFFVTDDDAFDRRASRTYIVSNDTDASSRLHYSRLSRYPGRTIPSAVMESPDLYNAAAGDDGIVIVHPAKRARPSLNLYGSGAVNETEVCSGNASKDGGEIVADEHYIAAVKAAAKYNQSLVSHREALQRWYSEEATREQVEKKPQPADEDSSSSGG